MERLESFSNQPTTEEWARLYGISTAPAPSAVEDYDQPCRFTARQIATRAVILQGVVAVACSVDPTPVVAWYQEGGIWEQVSPKEQGFLLNPDSIGRDAWNSLRWRQEAEWALLWVAGKVEALGLPNRQCDTRFLIDKIIPALGTDIELFLASAVLRSPGLLLAEDDRHYDLWCRYFQTRRAEPHMLPSDLEINVLYQRQYVFEWLHGIEAWDDVQCDA